MQAIDHVGQLTLVGQLGLIEHSLDDDAPAGIPQRYPAFALGTGGVSETWYGLKASFSNRLILSIRSPFNSPKQLHVHSQ